MSEQIYPIEHACAGLSQAASKLIGYAKQLAKQQKEAGMHFSAGCIYRRIQRAAEGRSAGMTC